MKLAYVQAPEVVSLIGNVRLQPYGTHRTRAIPVLDKASIAKRLVSPPEF